ncbi:MAG: hypothetical protein HY939_03605 [Gammaproteobacteria bacterium]|nr:hypothetical protein [Gammaproteobacteria bacterium]
MPQPHDENTPATSSSAVNEEERPLPLVAKTLRQIEFCSAEQAVASVVGDTTAPLAGEEAGKSTEATTQQDSLVTILSQVISNKDWTPQRLSILKKLCSTFRAQDTPLNQPFNSTLINKYDGLTKINLFPLGYIIFFLITRFRTLLLSEEALLPSAHQTVLPSNADSFIEAFMTIMEEAGMLSTKPPFFSTDEATDNKIKTSFLGLLAKLVLPRVANKALRSQLLGETFTFTSLSLLLKHTLESPQGTTQTKKELIQHFLAYYPGGATAFFNENNNNSFSETAEIRDDKHIVYYTSAQILHLALTHHQKCQDKDLSLFTYLLEQGADVGELFSGKTILDSAIDHAVPALSNLLLTYYEHHPEKPIDNALADSSVFYNFIDEEEIDLSLLERLVSIFVSRGMKLDFVGQGTQMSAFEFAYFNWLKFTASNHKRKTNCAQVMFWLFDPSNKNEVACVKKVLKWRDRKNNEAVFSILKKRGINENIFHENNTGKPSLKFGENSHQKAVRLLAETSEDFSNEKERGDALMQALTACLLDPFPESIDLLNHFFRENPDFSRHAACDSQLLYFFINKVMLNLSQKLGEAQIYHSKFLILLAHGFSVNITRPEYCEDRYFNSTLLSFSARTVRTHLRSSDSWEYAQLNQFVNNAAITILEHGLPLTNSEKMLNSLQSGEKVNDAIFSEIMQMRTLTVYAELGYYDVVECLLKKGMSPNIPDFEQTALIKVLKSPFMTHDKKLAMLNLLFSYGAMPNPTPFLLEKNIPLGKKIQEDAYFAQQLWLSLSMIEVTPNQRLQLIALFLENGLDPNVFYKNDSALSTFYDEKKVTVSTLSRFLHLGPDVVSLLLTHGTRLQLPGETFSILFHIIGKVDVESCRLLVNHAEASSDLSDSLLSEKYEELTPFAVALNKMGILTLPTQKEKLRHIAWWICDRKRLFEFFNDEKLIELFIGNPATALVILKERKIKFSPNETAHRNLCSKYKKMGSSIKQLLEFCSDEPALAAVIDTAPVAAVASVVEDIAPVAAVASVVEDIAPVATVASVVEDIAPVAAVASIVEDIAPVTAVASIVEEAPPVAAVSNWQEQVKAAVIDRNIPALVSLFKDHELSELELQWLSEIFFSISGSQEKISYYHEVRLFLVTQGILNWRDEGDTLLHVALKCISEALKEGDNHDAEGYRFVLNACLFHAPHLLMTTNAIGMTPLMLAAQLDDVTFYQTVCCEYHTYYPNFYQEQRIALYYATEAGAKRMASCLTHTIAGMDYEYVRHRRFWQQPRTIASSSSLEERVLTVPEVVTATQP